MPFYIVQYHFISKGVLFVNLIIIMHLYCLLTFKSNFYGLLLSKVILNASSNSANMLKQPYSKMHKEILTSFLEYIKNMRLISSLSDRMVGMHNHSVSPNLSERCLFGSCRNIVILKLVIQPVCEQIHFQWAQDSLNLFEHCYVQGPDAGILILPT